MTAEPAPRPDPPPRNWLDRLREVRAHGDRRATVPLVDALLTGVLDDELHEEVTDTLCVLEDLRCEALLTEVLLAGRSPLRVREAALRILTCLPCDDPPPLRIAAWLEDSDPLVRAHGATFLVPRDQVRLAALMHDPAAVVRRAAVESLVAAARTPLLVDALRRALRDPDPAVREVACRAALFDEPIAVTYDLLHLLDDADPDVRCSVYDALEDYPCVSVLLALADARSGPEGELAAVTLGLLVTRITATLVAADDAGIARILRWVAPARWVLDEDWEAQADRFGDDAGTGSPVASDAGEAWMGGDPIDALLADFSDDGQGADPVDSAGADPVSGGAGDDGQRAPVDLGLARCVLRDPCGPPAEQRDLLVSRDWSGTGDLGLTLLREVARSSAWSLRHGAAVALFGMVREGDRGAADVLLGLARDCEPVVRRIALHTLTHVRDLRALEPAREALADDGARHLAGDAALQAIVLLGTAGDAEAALRAELQIESDRDGLRLGAVRLAEQLELVTLVPELRAIVAGPVVAGVAAHVAALRALRSMGVTDGVAAGHLEGIDHLDVQAELGAWDWHGRRYG